MTQNLENHLLQNQSMDYSSYYQNYDPSSQYYQTPDNDYQYSYSYHHHTYNVPPHAAAAVQPPLHDEQEPDPPGVSAPVYSHNSYYQYAVPSAATTVVNMGPHYQPIVPSSYGGIGRSDGGHPQQGITSQFGPTPNVYPHSSRGRGGGRGLGRVRGRGHGRGRSLHKYRLTPIQDQKGIVQGAANIQGMPSQPTSQNSTDSGYVPMPVHGKPTSAFAPRKLPRCELCNVECDTHEILEQHKNGKKHQKNLKRNAISGRLEQVSTSELRAEVSFQPNQIGGFKNQSFQSLSTQPVSDEGIVDPHKNATAHHQHQTLFAQGTTPVQATPPGALPQYSTSSVPVPVPVPSQSRPVPIHHPRLVTCHLCKVDCNTLEIYEKHKNGKKHQKNLKAQGDLQKCKNSIIGGQMEPNSLISEWRPEIPTHTDKVEGSGVQQCQPENSSCQQVNIENKVEVENGKVGEGEPTKESAERVKTDHFEGGKCGFKRKMREAKLGRRVRTHNGSKRPEEPPKPKELTSFPCELCNIKCESLVVYQSHLLGKKHLAKAKRLLGDPEILAALGPTIQALIQQSTFASSSIAPFHHQIVGPSEGYSAQNTETVNVQESAPVSEIEKATVETVRQLQSLSDFFIARHMVNTEAKSEGGHSESQGDMYVAGGLVTKQREGEPLVTEAVTCATVMNGASVSEQNVVAPPIPGPNDATGVVQSIGGNQAQ